VTTPILPCARCKTKEYVYLKENSMGHNTRGIVCEMCQQSTSYYWRYEDAIREWNDSQREQTKGHP
jgi:hypothetical protein